ncbi:MULTISPECIES: carbohydrate ABC transporter permease [Cryobacterium]|uniref:Carbohydrate ABC transporter permease n=1 Tax=Cryobacterium breve TaxID=1259258 RepID=A0ABY2JAI9_9MICO|nr:MULTISPECIES: carbohydrate ABC transporter permease [Cryobacterium]TFC91247.1 carbohydrate ABC transporter permease [Cryobacterium sp. TmT3-12]TFD01059.1 carbohydrate ABC transporter permease [Cryobacterium breve]
MADRGARRTHRRRVAGVAWHLTLSVVTLTMIFPVLWGVLTSFKPTNEIYSLSPFSASPTLEHYAHAISDWPVGQLIGNTFVMAAGVALGQLAIAILGAFALAFFAPSARGLILTLLTISLAIPPQALIIPQFLLTAKLGWLNSDLGLIVPQLGASALAVLLLLQHVDALPPSLLNAARLDGTRPREVLWSIVLPALRPAIAAVTILVFITTWNEYLWPLLVAPRQIDTTVQIGLRQFETAEGTNFGGLLAAATLTSLPILVVYLVASRRITDAFLQSGIK